MKKILLSFIIVCVVSCASDDGNEIVIDEPALEDLRAESIEMLAGTDGRVWQIIQASLQNQQNNIDISSNFNVVDDEFIFTDASIEWRQAHAIKYIAANADEAKQDYYVAPENYSYSFEPESATRFSSNAAMQYEIIHNDSISANFDVSNGVELQLLLVPKTVQDYASVENTALQFTQAFTVNTILNRIGKTGMESAQSQNSIYIVTQEDLLLQKLIQVNMTTMAQNEVTFLEDRFADKRIHIVGNRLSIASALTVDDYSVNGLQYLGNGVENTLLEGWENFGSATQGDDIYIVGGRLHGDRSLIYRYNLQTQTYSEFANLPEDRFGADAVVVGDNLYVFGGKTIIPYFTAPEQTTIYIVPLSNPSAVQTLQMTQSAAITYVRAYQNLIYIASVAETSTGLRNTISVFNTLDNTYQDLSHDLDTTNPQNAIQGMCLLGNKIYVLYGENAFPSQDWKVYEATLD
ncbi:Kelch motif protein [Kordia sp. SMS9]|uniref:hypothetical protein n=1 Tax=Kordia sp. SMS9 TaxID=2282170 RepID=UPI000E0DFDD6|nr:hypothetical protein [Kordia sp. SMS9]AXG68246.1 Kelch motif protein [Kordia sp. SMS9]